MVKLGKFSLDLLVRGFRDFIVMPSIVRRIITGSVGVHTSV